MINADRADHREYASGEFFKRFKEELSSENSFKNRFSDIPWISIQYAPDSTFRTVTWQIDKGEGDHAYFGYLQKSDNSFYELAGKRGRSTVNSNQVLSFEQWKGALIYKILQLPDSTGTYYLLTYHMMDAFTKVKTLEPIQFEDGQVLLGKNGQFDSSGEVSGLDSRLVIKYSMDANAGINYDPDSRRLVYDNLVAVQGRIPGQGPTLVPDGSYRAYEWSEDKGWDYVEKLFSQWNEGPLEQNRDRTNDRKLFKKKNR